MACGLHNLYSYFLTFKDIITAQSLVCISLSAREFTITEWRKVLVTLRRERKDFQGELEGTGAVISS